MAPAPRQAPSWSAWQRLWLRHAESPTFAARLREAERLCRDGAKSGRLYASLSGGKDSVAMVSVMAGALRGSPASAFQCAHARSSLTLPGSTETAVAVCDLYGLPLDAEEPAEDPLSWLAAAVPRDADAFSPAWFGGLMRLCGAGNLMVNYQYKSHLDRERHPGGGLTVGFVGLRADESRGRGWTARTHGPLYQNRTDATWRCCPLLGWTARDVWALTASRGLPVHPFYRRYADELGGDPEGPGARVDLILAPGHVAQRGALQPVRRLYPELWGALLRARPEAARYG